MSAPDVLQRLLAVEQATAYGYGLLGGQLSGAPLIFARQCEDAHRARRDAVVALLRDAKVTPGPASPAYDLPDGTQVVDAASAVALAVRLEEHVAGAQLDAISATADDAVRRLALDAVQDSAVRAARWRAVAGTTPATVAFPGRA